MRQGLAGTRESAKFLSDSSCQDFTFVHFTVIMCEHGTKLAEITEVNNLC